MTPDDLNTLSDEYDHPMDSISSEPSQKQLADFVKLMSRHKPGKEKQKSKTKARNRARLSTQKLSRKRNRK